MGMSTGVTSHAPQSKGASAATGPLEFPALRDSLFPVHKIADQLEPYLRVIVEKFHPEKVILFGSQAHGTPDEHSDVDLLIVRRGITSENDSNLEIRRAFWSVAAPRPSFTILSKTPERLQQALAEGSGFFEEILSNGLELYAASTLQRRESGRLVLLGGGPAQDRGPGVGSRGPDPFGN